MAGKKAKTIQNLKKVSFDKLKPAAVLCPICRTIFDQPVTLPCNHAFCKPCFEGSMEKANLMCPLCRLRVGSWYRRTKRDGKLINEELWNAVQQQYPLEVKNKLIGLDNDIEKGKSIIRVSHPGEIRQEYEKERRKYLEEQQLAREAEENASAALIKKLALEAEYKNTVEEERLRWDTLLAKKLSEEFRGPSTSKQPAGKPKVAKKFGPMDRLIQTEDWISSHGFSQQKKNLAKNKQLHISPNFPKACFSKEYTCHVIPVEQNPMRPVRGKSFLGFGFKPNSGIQKCLKLDSGQRKMCVSGYKSSTSAENSDVIDQECRFYFKPIDSQRRYHVPGTIPRKVVPLMPLRDGKVFVSPPSGKVHDLGHVDSAFTRIPTQSKSTPTCNEIQKDFTLSPTLNLRIENRKRSIHSQQDSPVNKRRVNSKQDLIQGRTESPPFYGFDNRAAKSLSQSPFSGFDALNVEDSENKTNAFSRIVSKFQSSGTPKRLGIPNGNSGRESSSSKENNFDLNIPKAKTAKSDITNTTKPMPSPVANQNKRRIQEESDFQLAKKLQAEFNLIGRPLMTRGSRRRQITLDEMLVV